MTSGIILCGGQSSRMGFPKAWLPFGPETMLARVGRLLAEVANPIVVVAAAGQDLPEITRATVVRDRRPGRGPLEGIAAGLEALAALVEGPPTQDNAAYVTSCDVPLLSPAFIRRMIELLDGHAIAVPHVGGFYHPLAAVYRTDVLADIHRLLAEDRMRPAFLFEEVDTRVVRDADLADVESGATIAADPLASLRNLNHPEDYFTALCDEGLDVPHDIRQALAGVDVSEGDEPGPEVAGH